MILTGEETERKAKADDNMQKWIAQQAKKRHTFRPVRLICMLGFVVWFACTYVWR